MATATVDAALESDLSATHAADSLTLRANV
jgi:hypothetical protein